MFGSICGCKPISAATFVHFATVAYVIEMDTSLRDIELVQHAIIADSEFIFGSALQSLMRKGCEASSHVIDFSLDGFAHGRG
jgi:hypothetical protein